MSLRVGEDKDLKEPRQEVDGSQEAATEEQKPSSSSSRALGSPYVKVTSETETETETETEDRKKRRPANLVTSWGPRATKLKLSSTAGNLKVPATRTSPRLAPQLPPKSSYVKQSQATLLANGGGSRPMTPRRMALKAKVEAAVANARNSPRLAKITPKRLGTNTRAQLSGARTPEMAKYQGKSTAALARTPEVMKRYKAKLSQGQNAIRSMMDTESFRAKLAARKEVSATKKTSQSVPAKPVLTKPVEFKFTTSTRVRTNSASKTAEVPDFTR